MQFSQMQPIDPAFNQKIKGKNKVKQFTDFLFSVKGLLIIVIACQILLFIVFGLPILQSVIDQRQVAQITEEIANSIDIKINEFSTPLQVIADVKSLQENEIDATVYKDAKNGDYVIGYGDKMVIYRLGEKKVVYNDLNPNAILEKAQKEIVSNIVTQAKNLNLIPQDSAESPTLSLVSDPSLLIAQEPVFYRDVKENDVIAVFGNAQVILIYRQEGNSVINYGKVSTSIQKIN